ncbi:MAG TPA: hypothetical protein VGI92_03055 [Gemmatimonadales bacterium]|jgi:hypothetical protein
MTSRPILGLAVAIFAASSIARAQQPMQHTDGMNHDSAFAAVQKRGATVMGVDQYTSKHVFESLPDGGRIALQREVEDSAGTAQIRHHLAETAGQFARGDFTSPMLVHARVVPGTRVMARKRRAISYDVDTLPRGGQIRIHTTDPGAIAAIHDFLAFQRQDHRAGQH